MKIALASDHGGYELKSFLVDYLKSKGHEVVDFGTNSNESCNYPLYAKKVANAILSNEFKYGILVCGTGLGMQMSANRFSGIRATCVSDTYSARMAKEHNNSNILCLGQRVIGQGLAVEVVETWLKSEFQAGRHLDRINMIDN